MVAVDHYRPIAYFGGLGTSILLGDPETRLEFDLDALVSDKFCSVRHRDDFGVNSRKQVH